jgi:hypothetical protein
MFKIFYLPFFCMLEKLVFEFSALHFTAGALLLKPYLRFILLWLFWRWGVANYLPGLALNSDPPNLIFPGI